MKKTLILNTKTIYLGVVPVTLNICYYAVNNSLSIDTVYENEEGDMELFGSVTRCLVTAPTPENSCAYIDTNNMPYIEDFIKEYNLGEFTGITSKSGFCTYPLYRFNIDVLKEYDPDGVQFYLKNIKEKEEG